MGEVAIEAALLSSTVALNPYTGPPEPAEWTDEDIEEEVRALMAAGADLSYLDGIPYPDIERPHPSRLDPTRPDYDEIIRAHEMAVVGSEPGYTDPSTGLFVLTVEYLRARGECCDGGCRHCPLVGKNGD